MYNAKKLYPTAIIVMIINLLFHDLPQTLIVYFYYARYKPPSLDLRIENLIQQRISKNNLDWKLATRVTRYTNTKGTF